MPGAEQGNSRFYTIQKTLHWSKVSVVIRVQEASMRDGVNQGYPPVGVS